MANSSTLYSLAAVLTQLSSTLSARQSGTFLIATEQNSSCRFAIERGIISHCTYGREQGKVAVLSLLQVQQASCSFSEHLMLPFRAAAAVEHEFCVQTLGLQPVIAAELLTLPIETAQPTPQAALDTNTNRRKRFYRGGYALGEDNPAV